MIRYTIQAMAMVGDLMLIGASALALYIFWDIFPTNVVVAFLVVKCFQGWQENGGFEAWNYSVIKQFLANTKNIGL